MSPIILLFAAFLAYLLPKALRFLSKQSEIWKKGANIPCPPTSFLWGNAKDLPKGNLEIGRYFVNMGNDFASKGHSLFCFWFAHVLKVIPLDGKTVKEILDNNEEITKGNDYDVLVPWLGTGLLISTGDKWRSRRKMLTPTFHFKMLDGYVDTFNRESRRLTEIMEKFVGNGKSVDMFPYVKRCALDIICDTAMGIQLNAQNDDSNEYALAVDEMGYVTTVYSMTPYMWFHPLWKLTGNYKRYAELLKLLTDFTKNVIQERKQELEAGELSRGKMAFLDMLLAMKEANNLSDEDIREEVDTFMFEGHDTTTSGISWTLWCLATHPEIQEDVAKELHSVFGDSDRDLTLEDLTQLTYFDRVLKESMRLNPPVPFVGREIQKEMNMGGYTIPKGSQIMISPLMIHRNAQVYPEPLKFDPDRFLPENAKKRNAYDYIPFSAGPRNCIGQKFATYEEKIMVSWIIRKFKISTTMEFLDNGYIPEVAKIIGTRSIWKFRLFSDHSMEFRYSLKGETMINYQCHTNCK